MAWNKIGSGLFTTKTVYTLIRSLNHRQDHNSGKDFNWVWGQKLPNKIKYFLWLVTYGRLPTTQYLNSRDMNLNPICFFCNKEEETVEHQLIRCDNDNQCWKKLAQQSQPNLSISNLVISQTYWVHTLNKVKHQPFNDMLKQGHLIPLWLWQIWITMNINNFNHMKDHVPFRVAINNAVKFMYIAIGEKEPRHNIIISIKWQPNRGSVTS